jgi:16S rRNA processing protein RimM
MSAASDAQPWVVRGVVRSVHGIRGLLRATLQTDFPERVLRARELTLRLPDGALCTVTLEQATPYKQGLLLKLAGVDDRTGAEQWRGAEIVARADDLPALAAGEYYWHQLVGLRVVTVTGAAVGVITDILRTGSNDVYVTERAPRQPGPLIPAIDEVLERVDLEAGEVVIRPMPGLLEP